MAVAFRGRTRNNGGPQQGRRMNIKHYLFGFHGRATRAEWWLFVLIFIVYGFVELVICNLLFGFLLGLLVGYTLLAPMIWPGLAVSERRLHDRGKRGLWLLLFFLTPLVLGTIKLWLYGDQGIDAIRHPTTLSTLLSLGEFVCIVWGIVELGMLPGQHGDNKYGPDRRTTPAKT